MRKLSRYIDRLLRQRKPRPFVPTDDEALALAAAITLRSARPEESMPRAEFISGLRERLAIQASQAEETVADEPMPAARRPRRMLLAGASAAAAFAALGAATDRVLREVRRPQPTAEPAPTLQPDEGTWQMVAASDDLAEGDVLRFDSGTVTGFVTREAGTVLARSGLCTHLGCLLKLNSQQRRLDCPCHRTFFTFDGQLIKSQLPTPPAPLPAIEVREQDGEIQVYVPPAGP